MGTINTGQQKVSFRYNSVAQSKLINEIFHKTIPLQIYEGMELTKLNESEMEISPGVLVAEDVGKKVSVRVETTEEVVISVAPSTPYVVCRYRWNNEQENYAEFHALDYDDVEPGDVILGRIIYKLGIIQEDIDSTLRGKTKSILPDNIIVAEQPVSKRVILQGGNFWINKTYVRITTPIVSPEFNDTTTSPRTDLLCLDSSGNLSIFENYTTEFPSQKLPLAKITRGENRGEIDNDEITILNANAYYFGGIEGQFLIGKYPLSTNPATDAFVVGNGSNSSSKSDAFVVKYDGNATIKKNLIVGNNLFVDGGEIDTSDDTLIVKRGTTPVVKITDDKLVIGDNLDDTTGMRNHGLRLSTNENATNPLFDIKNSGVTVLEIQKDVIKAPKLEFVSEKVRLGNQATSELYQGNKVSGQVTISHIDSSDSNPEKGSLFCIQEKLPTGGANRIFDLTSDHTNERRWTLELNNLVLKLNNSVFNTGSLRYSHFIGSPIQLTVGKIYMPNVPGFIYFQNLARTSIGGIWYYVVAPSYGEALNKPKSFALAELSRTAGFDCFTFPQQEGKYIKMHPKNITSKDYRFYFVPLGAAIGGRYIVEANSELPTEGLQYYDLFGDGSLYSVGKGVADVTKKVVIPQYHLEGEVTEISDNAFKNCSALPGYKLPDSISVIGESAFENCTSLQGDTDSGIYMVEQTIPYNTTEIKARAFKGCTGLQRVVFPSKLDGTPDLVIGEEAFMNCTSLTSEPFPPIGGGITINLWYGTNIKEIGDSAFENCIGLGQTLSIPDNTEIIGEKAFAECSGIVTLNIGGGVTAIGDNAFKNCTELLYATLGCPPPAVGSLIFDGCTKLVTIYVPSLQLTSYLADSNWSVYHSIIKPLA